MASQILGRFKRDISALDMIPSDGGCFEIDVDGERIYSKLDVGEFPEEAAILEKIAAQSA